MTPIHLRISRISTAGLVLVCSLAAAAQSPLTNQPNQQEKQKLAGQIASEGLNCPVVGVVEDAGKDERGTMIRIRCRSVNGFGELGHPRHRRQGCCRTSLRGLVIPPDRAVPPPISVGGWAPTRPGMAGGRAIWSPTSTPYREPTARPVFGGREVTTGFSGTWRDDQSEVFRHLAGGLPQRQFSGDIAPAGRLNDSVPARAAVNRSPSRRGALIVPAPKPITPSPKRKRQGRFNELISRNLASRTGRRRRWKQGRTSWRSFAPSRVSTIPRSCSGRPSARRRPPSGPRPSWRARPPRPSRRRARPRPPRKPPPRSSANRKQRPRAEFALEAERKAARDARYAARKGKGKKK